MSPSVHAADPFEEAQEAINKDIKSFGECHSIGE
jgi:hypothetical protein